MRSVSLSKNTICFRSAFLSFNYFNNSHSLRLKRRNRLAKAKYILLIAIFLFLSLFGMSSHRFVAANNDNAEDILSSVIFDTYAEIDNIDYSELENIFSNLDVETNLTFEGIVRAAIEGNLDIDANTILSYLFKLLIFNIKKIFPILIIILVVSIICRCLENFSPNIFKDGMADIINFVACGVVVLLLGKIFLGINDVVYTCLSSMQNIINILFPILLTLMTTMGATSSVAIYTPLASIMSAGASNIITTYIYPIYVLSFVLIIISCLTNKIKLDKFIEFLGSAFKWAFGFVFTIFSGVFAIKGISAGKFDSVSIFTTKFAVKNYIPIIGSYISDGFNYVLLSSMLVKNAVGLAGIILLALTILSPIIYVLGVKLLMQLFASLTELIGNSVITSLLSKLSKLLAFPIAIIVGLGFMFMMCVSLVICTGNIVAA